MANARIQHLTRFYPILDALEAKPGGARELSGCSGRLAWPSRGVYFFRAGGEQRSQAGEGPRIVRVGTHALTEGSRTCLWGRLSQHKGQEKTGGGDHRAWLFRRLVGIALKQVEDGYDPAFLDQLDDLVAGMRGPS